MKEKEFKEVANYAREEIVKISNKEFSYDFDSAIYRKGILEDLEKINKLNIQKNNVLDLGCGRGILTLVLSKIFKKAYGIDIKPRNDKKDIDPSGPLYGIQEKIWENFSERFKVNFSYYQSPRIDFENEKFDCVIAYAVLEHIPKKELKFVLREINRVLKKGGIIYISRTPRSFSFSERIGKYLGFGCHEKLFKEGEIKNLLKENNFEIKEFERTDFIPGFSIFKKISDNRSCFNLLWILEKAILKTPLKYLSHHYRIVAEKM